MSVNWNIAYYSNTGISRRNYSLARIISEEEKPTLAAHADKREDFLGIGGNGNKDLQQAYYRKYLERGKYVFPTKATSLRAIMKHNSTFCELFSQRKLFRRGVELIQRRIILPIKKTEESAATRDWTRDLQIFSLTLSQLSYRGLQKRLFIKTGF